MTIDYSSLSDDPHLAFVELANHFSEVVDAKLARMDENTEARFALLGYMNDVIAVAKALDIDEFQYKMLPEWNEIWDKYRNFDLELKSYLMQISISKTRIGKKFSVALSSDTKQKIHTLIAHIKEQIEGLSLDERKKNVLFHKLNAFAAEVDRSRTRFDQIMDMTLAIVGLGEAATGTLKPVSELVEKVTKLIAQAKSEEPLPEYLPKPEPKKQIEPPKRQVSHKANDEIPF